MSSNYPLSYTVQSFSDLCDLLALHQPENGVRKVQSTKANIKQAFMAYSTSLPKSINYSTANSDLVKNLLFRAIQHWCCVSFKIAPVDIQLLHHDTPQTILYCIAAICITSINPENQGVKKRAKYQRTEGFKKEVAYYYYKKARHYLNEIIFEDDVSVVDIQSYFCLSYTANLLRLPLECRTWQHLACGTLRNKIAYMHDSPALRQCWYRWYYVDAWMALAFNQDCLLPDQLPLPTRKDEGRFSGSNFSHCSSLPYQQHGCLMSNNTLLDFAVMTRHMRKYIRSIQQDTLPYIYDDLTRDMTAWWDSIPDKNIHLSNCYYSMRLVLLFYLFQYDESYLVTFELLLDGLDVTLRFLQGLQELKLRGCDQSTYHHMFSAIHQTLKCILMHIRSDKSFHCLETFAKQQFEMNLCVLEGTNAFVDDIYQMRSVGATIESEMRQLGFAGYDNHDKQAQGVFRIRAV